MNMMNKLILTVALTAACAVSAEAQTRYYTPSNSGYQTQTVYKPSAATHTYSNVVPASYSVASQPAANGFGGTEADIVAQTNAQRARYGLPPLRMSSSLMGSARQHAQWMGSANSLTHTRAAVAENIAAGQNSASEAMNSWMNSSGHRANILGRGYTSIGVASYRGSNGQTYWCQQFQ